MNNNLEIAEIARRALKYLIEVTAVSLSAYYIPQGKRL